MEIVLIIILFVAIYLNMYKDFLKESFANYWYCPKNKKLKTYYKDVSKYSSKKPHCVNNKWGYDFIL